MLLLEFRDAQVQTLSASHSFKWVLASDGKVFPVELTIFIYVLLIYRHNFCSFFSSHVCNLLVDRGLMLCMAETSLSHYLSHLNPNIFQLPIDHQILILNFETQPLVLVTSVVVARSICTFYFMFSFILFTSSLLRLLLFFITEYTKA